MFEEMRERGSKLPDMVEFLQASGWITYQHHDNWCRKGDIKADGVPVLQYDTHQAYEIARKEADRLKEAVELLCETLRTDPGYYESWKANIVMAIHDEYYTQQAKVMGTEYEKGQFLHTVFNDGADRFLQLLIRKPKQEW